MAEGTNIDVREKVGGILEKCALCGRIRGNHKARTYHCPTSRKTRIGYLSFHKTNVFTPKEKKA